MTQLKLKFLPIIVLLVVISITAGCEEEPMATISINETGSDVGGDVTGDGGSTSRSYKWNNSLNTVNYNMDITAANGGSFNLSITDADGTNVVNQTLTAGQGDDSKSGVSTAGSSGEWTINVTLTDFGGDGSFSISPGD